MEPAGPIKEPLWSLMLSTNDCHPGCGCDDDWFQITKERILPWLKAEGTAKMSAVLAQSEEMKKFDFKQLEEMMIQTNLCFSSKKDLDSWISEWSRCIQESMREM